MSAAFPMPFRGRATTFTKALSAANYVARVTGRRMSIRCRPSSYVSAPWLIVEAGDPDE